MIDDPFPKSVVEDVTRMWFTVTPTQHVIVYEGISSDGRTVRETITKDTSNGTKCVTREVVEIADEHQAPSADRAP